ncbi:MAG: hypothetical protein M1833_002883 [Piccolia ochrophora]|nr:MAG: hypothetical protein M1833_002883 [Piccolia ochrophora]
MESGPSSLNEGTVSTGSQTSTSHPGSIREEEPAVHPLPSKLGSRPYRYLRFTIFSLYRRLFSIVFVANLAALIVLVSTQLRTSSPPFSHIVTAASANIMVAILVRNQHVINLLFMSFELVPHSVPLSIRRTCAKVYHHGGIHSGCAVAGTMWFLLFAVLVSRAYFFADPPLVRKHPEVLALTWLLVALLVTIVVFAYPRFRVIAHDYFELIHRFAGWTACGLLWAFAVIFTNALRGSRSLGRALSLEPSFWFLIVITASIIYPWLYLRRVSVRPEKLSDHALRLWFHHRPLTQHGAGVAISQSPLTEWHQFATIPSSPTTTSTSTTTTTSTHPPRHPEWSILISAAGDWTKSIIASPPFHIWIRGIPTTGVIRIAPLFRRVVVVTTGSGIGPCLSLLVAHAIPCRILWSTPEPLTTYGADILAKVHEADPRALVIDTRKPGQRRPDMVALAHALYKESGAEAVFTISNPTLTRKLVYGLESRGVPSYGPIWDS